jgi:hydrogenase maturation protein HypF
MGGCGEELVAQVEKRGGAAWSPGEGGLLRRQLALELNAPWTSSAGRLFDAASALLGVCREGKYEGQPAIELEALLQKERPAVPRSEIYPFGWSEDGEAWTLDPAPLWETLALDVAAGAPLAVMAAKFHHTVAAMILAGVDRMRAATGLTRVALSGGTFQNRYLTAHLAESLALEGYEVLLHRRLPPNDGGLAVGQALLGDLLLAEAK